MRYLLLICLLTPALLFAQLKKAGKLVKKDKLEEALVLYDQLRNSPDSIEMAAAHYGYLKTFLRIHREPDNLWEALDLKQETAGVISGLSKAKRRELSKQWKASPRSVDTQEKILRRRTAQRLSRSNLEDFFDHRPLTQYPAWSDTSRRQLAQLFAKQEAGLLNAQLSKVGKEGILAYRPWLETEGQLPWSDASRDAIQALREQLVRSVANNDAATYEELSEVFSHHHASEAARNPRFSSLIDHRLVRKFFPQHGFEELDQFVADNPRHWMARDCYVGELSGILERRAYPELTGFLSDHPNTILDQNVVAFLLKNITTFRGLPGADVAALDQIERDEQLVARIKTGRDTSLATYTELVGYLERIVPAPRAYDHFRRAAQLYLSNKQWGRLDDLVAQGRRLFVFGQPQDCDVRWVYYENKQAWLKDVQEILAREDFVTRTALVPAASQKQVDEYSPVISADGRRLYFGRYLGKATTYDVVVSERGVNGGWEAPKLLPNLSSAKANEVPLSLTAAGNEMLLFLDGRLARSLWTPAGWSAPTLLTGTIADREWHGSATLSPDGNHLILETNYDQSNQTLKPDTELYLARRVNTGEYDIQGPISALNTSGREHSPYVSNDGRTLYFSTDGRRGLGKMDVYVARRQGQGWLNWSEPENFGKAINTFYDDSDFKLSTAADGKVGYYGVSDGTDFLSGNVYSAELPASVRPVAFRTVRLPVTWSDSLSASQREGVQVIVRAADGNAYSGSAIVDDEVFLLFPANLSEATVSLVNSSDTTGRILPITLPVDLKTGSLLSPIKVNAEENLRRGNERVRLVQPYDTNQDRFEPTAATRQQLQSLAGLLRDAKLTITIHAYSDDTGSAEYNAALCQRRAEAVRDFLLDQGITGDRLRIEAHGSEDFIETNDTDQRRAVNRRVELGFED